MTAPELLTDLDRPPVDRIAAAVLARARDLHSAAASRAPELRLDRQPSRRVDALTDALLDLTTPAEREELAARRLLAFLRRASSLDHRDGAR